MICSASGFTIGGSSAKSFALMFVVKSNAANRNKCFMMFGFNV